jgi:hypothetical protein
MISDQMAKPMEYIAAISEPQLETSDQLEEAELVLYEDGDLATIDVKATRHRKRRRKPIAGSDATGQRGGKRSEVSHFSRHSKRRLKRTITMLRSSTDSVYFGTLTLPESLLDSYPCLEELTDHARKSLDRFIDNLKSRYPHLAVIWRIEPERRKSGIHKGRVVPHFHLLIFIPKGDMGRTPTLTRLALLRQQVAELWNKAVRSTDPTHLSAGTQVKPVCWRKDRARITRYLSKATCAEDDILLGRRWGIRGRKNLPWAEPKKIVLSRAQGLKLRRFFRNFVGIPVDAHWRLPSLSVFISTGWLLLNLARLIA